MEVIRGYAKGKDGRTSSKLVRSLSRIAKTSASPRDREEKRHLITQGATIFKKEIARSTVGATQGQDEGEDLHQNLPGAPSRAMLIAARSSHKRSHYKSRLSPTAHGSVEWEIGKFECLSQKPSTHS